MRVYNPDGTYVEFFRRGTEPDYRKDQLVFRHGHIAITNYRPSENREFEKSLSVWDDMNFRYVQMAGYYVKELHEFRLPRSFDTHQLRQYFPNHVPTIDNGAYPADKIDIRLKVPPRDDEQKVALSFLCCQGDYKKNSRYTTLMLALGTGTGKSFVSAAATAFLQCRSVVIVPIAKLLPQWVDTFVNFTSIKKDEILVVRGSEKCEEIRNGEHEDKKVFIFMIQTIREYVKAYGNLAAMEMFQKTKAYVKIMDEVHKELKSMCMVEALCNFRMNYYASATPRRSGSKENWIYQNCFRNCPKFGVDFKTTDEKWTNIMIAQYRFTPTPMQIERMINKRTRWMNSKLFEKELIHSPPEQRAGFDNTVLSVMKWSKSHLVDGNKILILCSSVEGTEYMKDLAEQIFPGRCAVYHGQLKPKEKEVALQFDIICATSQSLGTGADIKKIQHVYMVGTYANAIDAGQLPGRARKLDDGTSTVYIEFVDMSWVKTYRQFEKRKPYLIKASKTGKLFMIE